MFAQISEAAPHDCQTVSSKLIALLSRVCSIASVRGANRKLRLCESLSLGEKRLIAVVEYGPKRFLLAATAENISLLQRLDDQSQKTEHDAASGVASATTKFSQT